MRAVTVDSVRRLYPPRDKWSHKGDHGKVLVIGGSRRFRGAPALCALAALRAGADIATVAAPESSADVIASFSPDIITEPMEGDYFNPENLRGVLAASERFDAVVIGNGMGRMARSMEAVLEFLRLSSKPCVIDADALYMITGRLDALRRGWIITPHGNEFFSLAGAKPGKTLESRVAAAEKFSREIRAAVLLKGYKDVIAEGGRSAVNSTGNPFMTVGGTGDVLAGICGALLAGGAKPFDAAAAGAYISGAAGDMAASTTGPGLVATDVIAKIPAVLKGILG